MSVSGFPNGAWSTRTMLIKTYTFMVYIRLLLGNDLTAHGEGREIKRVFHDARPL